MKIVLVVLAAGCAVVGLLWGLRWFFEGRVIAGSLSPDDAMLALDRWTVILKALVSIVAAMLAGLLLHLAAATRKCRHWPPSGRWPAPRAVSETEAETISRRLQWGAAAVALVGIGALATAVT
jgi:predicted histidine transporter YuiF (NhaC family)